MKVSIADLRMKDACTKGIFRYQQLGLHKIDWDEIKSMEVYDYCEEDIDWLCSNFHLTLNYKDRNSIVKYEKGLQVYYEDENTTKRIVYDDQNRPVIEDSNHYTLLTTYTDEGKVVSRLTNEGSSSYRVSYKAVYNHRGIEVDFKNWTGLTRKTKCNEDGLPLITRYSSGYWIKHDYNEAGKETFYRDGSGYWKHTKYDSQMRKVSEEHSDNMRLCWEYDNEGKLAYHEKYVNDAIGYKAYYDKGLVIRKENNDGSIQEYEYNGKGQMIKETEVDTGDTIEYAYQGDLLVNVCHSEGYWEHLEAVGDDYLINFRFSGDLPIPEVIIERRYKL